MILLYHKFDYLLIEKQTEALNCFFSSSLWKDLVQ